MRTKKKNSSVSAANAKQSQSVTPNIIADTADNFKANPKEKHTYWWAVLYPENMRSDWQQAIDDLIQLPFAYCVHNIDRDSKSEHRKDHVHIIIAWSNPTTYKHAFSVFDRLSASGRKALNKIESVNNIRHAYDYLIHDTDSCRKLEKELYPADCRVTGNCFDIGAYEQISSAEKEQMAFELSKLIKEQGFTNFADFNDYVIDNFDFKYFQVMRINSGYYERIIKGNFHRCYRAGIDPDTGEVLPQERS